MLFSLFSRSYFKHPINILIDSSKRTILYLGNSETCKPGHLLVAIFRMNSPFSLKSLINNQTGLISNMGEVGIYELK